MLCRVCGVLGHFAPVHRCLRPVRCLACAMSWATWLLIYVVLAPCVVLSVRCPWPLSSCSPVCSLAVLCCVACAVSWATWLLFTGVPARCVVLLVRCPRPLGSCSSVCPLSVLCRLCGVLGHSAPDYRCVRSVRCVSCEVFWATWLLFTGVLTGFVVLRVRCPGPLGSCSPVCPLDALCCVCCVLGHWAEVHRGARLVRCVMCAMYSATWLLFTGVPGPCVVLRLRCPGPLGSCSPVCSLGAL